MYLETGLVGHGFDSRLLHLPECLQKRVAGTYFYAQPRAEEISRKNGERVTRVGVLYSILSQFDSTFISLCYHGKNAIISSILTGRI